MAQNDFQTALSRTVKSSKDNSPSSFMTRLAHPLIFEGQLEVAIMDVTYHHEWFNLHEPHEFAIALPLGELDDEELYGSFNQDVELIQPRKPRAPRVRREVTEEPLGRRLRLIEPGGGTQIWVDDQTASTRVSRSASDGASLGAAIGGAPPDAASDTTQTTQTRGTGPIDQAPVTAANESQEANESPAASESTAAPAEAPATAPPTLTPEQHRARSMAALTNIDSDADTFRTFVDSENRKFDADMKSINLKNKNRLWMFRIYKIKAQEVTDLSELIREINAEIASLFNLIHPLKPLGLYDKVLRYYKQNHRAKFISHTKFMVVAPANASIIHVLGFGQQGHRFKLLSGDEYDFLYLERYRYEENMETNGKAPVSVHSISTM